MDHSKIILRENTPEYGESNTLNRVQAFCFTCVYDLLNTSGPMYLVVWDILNASKHIVQV